jgi:hypothetical protein
MRAKVVTTVVLMSLTGMAFGQSVSLTLSSPQNGQTVSPGSTVNWTIEVSVSSGDNFGLALVSVDLAQDAGNPELFDLSPADGVPTGMTNFSRPDGISNPGETNPTTGYIGVLRGTPGALNVVQIGGGQNSFGEALPPGTGMGENAVLVGGVGQSSPEVVATGSFTAPSTSGTYTFNLQNALANVLDELNSPPNFSAVSRVDPVDVTAGTISFTVGTPFCMGDSDCGGGSPDFNDINYFVAALAGETSWTNYHVGQTGNPPACPYLINDTNGYLPGGTPGVEFGDITEFVALIGQPCVPYQY